MTLGRAYVKDYKEMSSRNRPRGEVEVNYVYYVNFAGVRVDGRLRERQVGS